MPIVQRLRKPGLNDLTFVKRLEQCLAYSKHYRPEMPQRKIRFVLLTLLAAIFPVLDT